MKNLTAKYQYLEVEAKWKEYWETQQIYQWQADLPREANYVINTPPPTISGQLHMGHISSYTKQDFIGRFQRMSGKNVFYPIGFDNNGLPTERFVEKQRGIKGNSMSRQEFAEICQEEIQDKLVEYKQILRDMGFSIDWSQEYQTVSAKSKTLSQMSFLDLYRKGAIYQKEEPMYWDVVDQTALAQTEIEDREMASFMNEILFAVDLSGAECQMCPGAGGCGKILIGTTRPELLPACVAVFVHPEDLRYQELVGKFAITPVFHNRVPILADPEVSMDKGTGVVMCCTFGDQQDISWWRRYQLPLVDLIAKDGYLRNVAAKVLEHSQLQLVNPAAAQPLLQELEGLTVLEAREKVLAMLDEELCLLNQIAITHPVKCGERSKQPVEILVTKQWLIKVLDHKQELLDKARQCIWHPAHMRNRIENWIAGLSWDWCISRQRFFGVEIPVWYSKRPGEEGKVLLPEVEQLPVDPLVDLPKGYSREEVDGDPDVLDTWATSSISPQLSSGAITQEYALDYARHQKLYPADLQTHAHEIVRTWDFCSLVKSMYHENQLPWKHVMLCGWILAADKTKMSKSLGNVVTPEHLLQTKGADVVRYWASTARLGMDSAYSEETLKIGSKLITKLWNVAKFLQMHCQNLATAAGLTLETVEQLSGFQLSLEEAIAQGLITEQFDLWLLRRMQAMEQAVRANFANYEYAKAREIVEDFFWNELCDNYLEIVKIRCYGATGRKYADQQLDVTTLQQLQQQQLSAVLTIYRVFNSVLKTLAPFIPFVTEELFAHLYTEEFARLHSIHAMGSWPAATMGGTAEPVSALSAEESDTTENSQVIAMEDIAVEIAVDHSVERKLLTVIAQIRKYKTEHSLAMNAELQQVTVQGVEPQANPVTLEDLKNVTGVREFRFANPEAGEIEVKVL